MADSRATVIVHVVNVLEGGGTERTLVSLLRAFDPGRLCHVVVTLRSAGKLAANLPDHVACRPIAAEGPTHPAEGRSLRTGLKLAGLIRSYKADVVHARNTGCWCDSIVARVLAPRARLVLGFHGLETPRPFGFRQRHVARWGVRVGARFAAVSRAGCRQLRTQVPVPRARIDLLENGVDPARFQPGDPLQRRRIRDALNLDDAAFVVGIVGSLTPVKGHTTLIDAVARVSASVPRIQLMIVGEGPRREGLADRVRRWGMSDRVHFVGAADDVAGLMKAMDLYVCTSESEGMNNALLEAMASGLPIIATHVGDNARMVRDGVEGCIVPPASAESLADALTLLSQSAELRGRFSAAGRMRVSAFGFDRMVHAYQRYYETLIAAGP